MPHSHKFPPIHLHISESLFCVSSVLSIEGLEMFKTLSLPSESSQQVKRQLRVIKEALVLRQQAEEVPNLDLGKSLR